MRDRDWDLIHRIELEFDASLIGFRCDAKSCTKPAYRRFVRVGRRGHLRTWCADHWADFKCLRFAQVRDWASSPECVKPDRMRL